MEISINALILVFVALIVLYFIYQNNLLIKKILSTSTNKEEKPDFTAAPERIEKVEKKSVEVIKEEEEAGEDLEILDDQNVTEDVYAAIAMALYELQNDNLAHDWEETILTINKVKKDYSPWSSKLYGLRETPVLRKR